MSTEQDVDDAYRERPEQTLGGGGRHVDQAPREPGSDTELGRRAIETFPLDAEIDDNYVVRVPQGIIFERRPPGPD